MTVDIDLAKIFEGEMKNFREGSSDEPKVYNSQKVPMISLYAGNSKEELENLMECKKSCTEKAIYRGFSIREDNNDEVITEYAQLPHTGTRSIWFLYSGQGSHWHGMARQLILIPEFKNSFEKSALAIKPLGVDLFDLLYTSNKNIYVNNPCNSMVMIMAIEIAFTDLLSQLNIRPDGVIGFSLGEVCAGYADGVLTRDQAMKLAYWRGKIQMENVDKIGGALAAVGISWEEAQTSCLPGAVPVSNMGKKCVGIAGDKEIIEKMAAQFEAEGIFARIVDSAGLASHSPKMHAIYDKLLKNYTKEIPEPKLRSEKWVSTSVPALAICSGEYFAINTCNPILFYEALQKIPENAIIVELGPHSHFEFLIKTELPNTCDFIPLAKRGKPELVNFLKAIGKLYLSGHDVSADPIYSTNSFQKLDTEMS